MSDLKTIRASIHQSNSLNRCIENAICFSFVLAALLSIVSCEKGEEDERQLTFAYHNQWLADSMGCLGLRGKIVEESWNTLESYVGITESQFIELFGEPYSIRQRESYKIITYWISCGIAPKVKGMEDTMNVRRINTQAISMLVELDSSNIIREMSLVML